MKNLITWSVGLLLFFGASSCQPTQQPDPSPVIDPPATVYKLPLIDYDFAGSVDDIVAFETALGHTLDKAQSDANTLTFSTGDRDFPETVYHLENKRIMEIYQPCTSGEAVTRILPQLAGELEMKGWSKWSTPVGNGECDAAFLLLREINGTQTQVGSVLVHTRTNNAKKTSPSISFVFSRVVDGIDYNTVVLPDLYLDGLGKTKEEIKSYYEAKGIETSFSGSFLHAKVDSPAFKNDVCFFFKDGEVKCHSIIMTSVSFVLNKSENITNQLKKLGFEFDSERKGAINKFFHEEKGIWALVRFHPLSQFDQPNLTFTKQPKNY